MIAVLPQGRSMPAERWRACHKAIVQGTAGASAVLIAFMLLKGEPPGHALLQGAVPGALGAVAWYARWGQRVRGSLVAVALMSCAALAVHVTATIEAHFLFFIAIPIVALYEDWAPSATSVGAVLAHHLIVGLHDPASLYNHEAALRSPWQWGLVHGGLLLAMCVVSVLHWRSHESARTALTRLSLHDDLTGLANRRLFMERLEQALADAAARGDSVSLLMMDLDGFKTLNDTFGHAFGDTMLAEIGRRLAAAIRPGDTPARLGGDEFALVLPDTGIEEALHAAQRVIDVVSRPVAVGQEQVAVGASVGVAVASDASIAGERLVEQADRAMLAAKRNGRGTRLLYHPHLDQAGSTALLVAVRDAREWARYMRALREEIAAKKAAGQLPVQSRGPDSLFRVFNVLLGEIDRLPDEERAHLELPDQTALEEFVFHQTLVHDWADSLVQQGVLGSVRSPGADLFWCSLYRHVTVQPGGHAAPLQPDCAAAATD